uniref:DNA damage-inducible transcript 4 protein n=3 Tax=Nothobranchius furzeri TaxID=105023 RepID=A0A1A8AVW1_NOTFU
MHKLQNNIYCVVFILEAKQRNVTECLQAQTSPCTFPLQWALLFSPHTPVFSCLSLLSAGMLPGKIQRRCRAHLFDWLLRHGWAGLLLVLYKHCCGSPDCAAESDSWEKGRRRSGRFQTQKSDNNYQKTCLQQPQQACFLTNSDYSSSCRTNMPEVFASMDNGSTPPSPVDSSPRRLSWGKLVQRLTDFSTNSTSMESGSSHGSRSDLSESGSDISSDQCPSNDDLFYDPMEETILKEVVDLIALSLREAKDSDCALRCAKLLIPEKLLEHIGQELLHLAASEPCGLRGALIDLCVEQGSACESIGQLSVDPYLVPTFQLTLVLRLESGGLWPKIQGLFTSKSPSTPVVRQAIKLGTGFRVIRKKLYCSEDLLIEEC